MPWRVCLPRWITNPQVGAPEDRTCIGRLRRAISNLIVNAIKYGPTGSAIAIDASRDDGAFVVRVSDSGPGVEPDERERIFEKFSRGRGPDERCSVLLPRKRSGERQPVYHARQVAAPYAQSRGA